MPVMTGKPYNVRRCRQAVTVGLISLAVGCTVPAQNAQPPIVVSPPATAAAGWYLIVPPLVNIRDDEWMAGDDAPLGKWTIMSSYQNVTDCQEQADYNSNHVSSQIGRTREYSDDWAKLASLMFSICVASNDARLAK